jgi:acetylcholinesterase
MFLSILLASIATLISSGYCFPPIFLEHGLRVKTDSGVLNGFMNAAAPNVRQFLGIPYADAPHGPRRWLPPTRKQSNALINATAIGPGCPQNPLAAQTNTSVYAPKYGNQTEYFPPQDFSEDCLTLNIWTPQTSQPKLPVIVWYYGSGFTQGGTESFYYNPQSWIQRTKHHIVVSVNVRANIFGFPNALGLSEQNLGLLDQRLSLEWIRDNIAAFGGDPSRIVAWGQSAGAIAIDYLNFAHPSDPIAHGMILDSATALYPASVRRTSDTTQSNFTAVAASLNCASAVSQIECLRNVSWQAIASILQADTSLKFLPVVDNKLVFADYTQRYEEMALSHIPALIGTNQHEFNVGVPYPLSPNFTQEASDAITNRTTLCTAARTSRLRQKSGRTTYRFQYDGDFANISPKGYPGAYHAAELPLIFGTEGRYHGASTEGESRVSRVLQDFWVEFARDPQRGLGDAGWGTYSEGKAMLLGGLDVDVKEISIDELDGVCDVPESL